MNDSGPALPTTPSNFGYAPDAYGPGTGAHSGMSLRDYFAAQALPGVIRSKTEGLGWQLKGDLAYGQGSWHTSPKMLADAAYRIADAMIERRDQ